ncbi:M50 family metallopeptidase [Rhodanobacter sp. L36]|uniref:M50 family metallopeptidase n=1 Tax=Rhodanobacter sp. L36 TaxID=1747221 RepID=UPI00131B107A|nr:M50 family metallopeptidase [Rhodanobacter sp. L36]
MSPLTQKRLDRIFRPIQWIVGFASGVTAFVLCSEVENITGIGHFLPLIALLLSMFFMLLIHELGHYAAARFAGMTVTHFVVGRIEIVPQQRGWRMRWNRGQKIRVDGLVIAACDPIRALRPQVLLMTAGGPAANLVIAAISAALANVWSSAPAGSLCMAFAVLNVAMGVTNLLPSMRGLASDGMRLLIWSQKELEHSPLLAHTRLQALSISGVTADQLPVDQIALLDSQPMPAPLVALWYRVKAHQNRGEWQHAADLQASFDSMVQSLPEPVRIKLIGAFAQLRAELAFSRAMQNRDATGLSDNLLTKAQTWSAPSLWPRCLALRALLNGDTAHAHRQLDNAQKIAKQSMDKALPRSEAKIRAHMLSIEMSNTLKFNSLGDVL